MGFSAGSANSPKGAQAEIDKALAPLQTKSGVELSLKRKSVNSLLAREKNGEGKLFYRKGKLRLEMQSPDESLLVLDGKTVWLETKLDKEMGGKTIVSKTSTRSLKKSSTLLTALLENGRLAKEFKLSKRKEENGEVKLDFLPKVADKSEIQTLSLWIDGAGLRKVLYTDDKENEVTFEFGEPMPLDSKSDQLFVYKPPKGAEVTEF